MARIRRSDPRGDAGVFLFAYLNLNRWHVRYAQITAGGWYSSAALTAIAVFNPPVASGVARISLAIVAVAGLGWWFISRRTASTAPCC